MNINFLLTTVFLAVVKVIAVNMEVFLSNPPGFYYGHRCFLDVAVVSDKFIKFNDGSSELFLFTVLESSEDARFLNYWTFPYVYKNNSVGVGQARIDNCKRGIATSRFYCASIISSKFAWPEVQLKINQTHKMYKFTLTNLVCPRTNKGIGDSGYHLKLKIDVPASVNVPDIVMSKNMTYRFTNLKYRVVQKIIGNQITNSDGSLYTKNGNSMQAKNYQIEQDSFLQLNMYLANQTEINSWETLELKFLQASTFFQLNAETCNLETSFQNKSTLIYSKVKQSEIDCQYMPLTNSFLFKNKNFSSNSAFIYNQDFNRYQLFQAPAVRLKFKVGVKFSQQAQIQFSYRVTATTTKQINDSGQLVNISTTTATLYDSSNAPETMIGLNSSQYNKIDPRLRAPVVPKPIQNQTNETEGFMSQFFNNLLNISELPLLVVAAILIVSILTVCIRKEPWKCEKYIFLIFVLSDLFLKVIIISIINGLAGSSTIDIGSNNKQVSFILSVFLAIQYGGLGVVLFFTYWLYILASKRQKKPAQSNAQNLSNQKQGKSTVLIILAMLFNYKFYCVCLFDMKIGKDLKPRRFRNNQLYIKFCWHIGIEVFLILVQIFCVLSSCTLVPVSILFAVHQGVFVVLMALIGKSVFRMLSLTKMKKKIKKICNGQSRISQNVNEDANQVKKSKSLIKSEVNGIKQSNSGLKNSQKLATQLLQNENDLTSERKL